MARDTDQQEMRRKGRENLDHMTSDGAADSVCHQWSGESRNAHRRNGETGHACLTSTRQDRGIFIAEDMDRTSTLRAENVSYENGVRNERVWYSRRQAVWHRRQWLAMSKSKRK
jgi:hypothetical protein